MISNRCGIVWLCLTVLVTLALVLPYHLLLLLHAADYTFSPTERVKQQLYDNNYGKY